MINSRMLHEWLLLVDPGRGLETVPALAHVPTDGTCLHGEKKPGEAGRKDGAAPGDQRVKKFR